MLLGKKNWSFVSNIALNLLVVYAYAMAAPASL